MTYNVFSRTLNPTQIINQDHATQFVTIGRICIRRTVVKPKNIAYYPKAMKLLQ